MEGETFINQVDIKGGLQSSHYKQHMPYLIKWGPGGGGISKCPKNVHIVYE